jgi:hypothetical protein
LTTTPSSNLAPLVVFCFCLLFSIGARASRREQRGTDKRARGGTKGGRVRGWHPERRPLPTRPLGRLPVIDRENATCDHLFFFALYLPLSRFSLSLAFCTRTMYCTRPYLRQQTRIHSSGGSSYRRTQNDTSLILFALICTAFPHATFSSTKGVCSDGIKIGAPVRSFGMERNDLEWSVLSVRVVGTVFPPSTIATQGGRLTRTPTSRSFLYRSNGLLTSSPSHKWSQKARQSQTPEPRRHRPMRLAWPSKIHFNTAVSTVNPRRTLKKSQFWHVLWGIGPPSPSSPSDRSHHTKTEPRTDRFESVE